MELYHQTLAAYTELGIKTEMARTLNNIGNVHARRGELDQAEAPLLESLRLREEIGDRQGIAESLQGLAGLARRQGNLELAESRYADSLRRYEAIGDQRGIAQALIGMQHVLMPGRPAYAGDRRERTGDRAVPEDRRPRSVVAGADGTGPRRARSGRSDARPRGYSPTRSPRSNGCAWTWPAAKPISSALSSATWRRTTSSSRSC